MNNTINKTILLFSLLITLAPQVSFAANKIATQGELISADKINSSISQIGEIKQALLTEAQFQSLSGDCWRLMNGSSLLGTDLGTLTGRSTIPDARGSFLRMENNGRTDGQQNPEAKLLGDFQSDAMQGHKHLTNGNTAGNGGNGIGGSYTASTYGSTIQGASVANVYPALTAPPISDGTNGVPRTASETRSKNITVNFFIKVNKECNFN